MMKILKRSALLFSLMAALGLPGLAQAEDTHAAHAAHAAATPAAAAPAVAAPATSPATGMPMPMDDMKAMMQSGQMMGGKCKMHDGSGMMPPAAGNAGKPCPRAGDATDCACPKAAELSKRVDELEKRLDMMQMMMKKKMMH